MGSSGQLSTRPANQAAAAPSPERHLGATPTKASDPLCPGARAGQSIGTLRETASKYRLATLPGTGPGPNDDAAQETGRFPTARPARDGVSSPIGHGTKGASDFGGVVSRREGACSRSAYCTSRAHGTACMTHIICVRRRLGFSPLFPVVPPRPAVRGADVRPPAGTSRRPGLPVWRVRKGGRYRAFCMRRPCRTPPSPSNHTCHLHMRRPSQLPSADWAPHAGQGSTDPGLEPPAGHGAMVSRTNDSRPR